MNEYYIRISTDHWHPYGNRLHTPLEKTCSSFITFLFITNTSTYVKALMREYMFMAKRFSNLMTYVVTLNNARFEKEISNIYPPELTLRENLTLNILSYLDISISICSGKYVTELYDKGTVFICLFANFLYDPHNFLYQNPCLIIIPVIDRCLFTKSQ